MAYNTGRHLSSLHLVTALESLAVAYYQDQSCLEALHTVRAEVERRLTEWACQEPKPKIEVIE